MSNRSTLGVRDAALALASLGALAAQALAGFGSGWVAVPAGVAVVVAAVAALVRSRVRGAALLVALLALAVLGPWPWQASMALALGGWALLHRLARLDAEGAWPWRWGRLAPGWVAVVGGVTPAALLAWLRLFRPDLSDVRALVPAAPLPWLVAGGVLFALVNATLEELVWRGVLQPSLEGPFGIAGAVVVQALSFGIEHAHGIPRGPMGMLLAGSWAVMLGVLRRKTGGLLAPIVAHVVADATIAVIILVLPA